MKITVLGAAGEVGRRVVAEALARGHQVTAQVRSAASSHLLPAEASAQVAEVPGDLASLLAGQDLVISALRPADGQEAVLPELTAAVLDAAANAGVRVLIVGGAARLRLSDQNAETVLTAPGFLPAEIIPIAQACQQQFERCLSEPVADWTYASPAALLQPGTRSGSYRLGTDTLVTDAGGASRISLEDFAVALLDEAEVPRFTRSGFTVGY
ncbi:MAG: NAD(P)H-binding protein [Pseudomonadaceae bacterium]